MTRLEKQLRESLISVCIKAMLRRLDSLAVQQRAGTMPPRVLRIRMRQIRSERLALVEQMHELGYKGIS